MDKEDKVSCLPGPVCEVGQEHPVEGQRVHVDVRPLGQVGHILDHGVQVVEAGDGGEHPVHDAGPEQAVTQLRGGDHIHIGQCGP